MTNPALSRGEAQLMGSKTPVRRRRWLLISGLGVLVLVLAGFGLSQLVLKPDPSSTTTSRTVTASTQTVQTTVGTAGTLEPKRRADLSFGSSGTVTAVEVSVGERVSKGAVLAKIDDSSLQADLDGAQADLDAAESNLSDLTAGGDATSTAIAAAEAQVTLKKSALSQAKAAVKATTLRSTIAGTVAAVDIAKGDQVGSGGSGSGGSGSGGSGSGSSGSGSSGSGGSSGSSSAAITVISTDTYVVDTSVGSADLARIKPGLQAVITPTGATEPIYGTVATVGVMASTSGSTSGSGGSTATFPVTIDVTQAQKGLFAGASATVSIIVEQRDNVLVVPTAAITMVDGKTVVQKVVGGSPVQTEVTIGSTYGAETEIVKGLADGDQVVISFTRQAGTGTGASSGTNQRQGGFGNGGFGNGGFGTGRAGTGQGGTGQGGTGQGGTGQGGNR